MYGVVRDRLFIIEIFQYFVKMDKDQWMHDIVLSEEVYMNEENEEEPGVHQHVDCSYAYNTS